MIGYLDYQVLDWYKQVPDKLRFDSVESPEQRENESRYIYRLRVILYLRMNQSRILIYRPILHSASSIAQDRSHAQTVVGVAKDTVRVLTRLNQVSDMYRTGQACLNYFLVAALAVLYLAVCHAPVDFNGQVRDEFAMALDLIRRFSARSFISRRLWHTVRGLRRIGEKLGVLPRPTEPPHQEEAHSTATVTMAGLARHSVDDLPAYRPENEVHKLDGPQEDMQMSHELSNLFEAVGGLGDMLVPASNHAEASIGNSMSTYSSPGGAMYHHLPDGLHGGVLQEGELAQVIHDLF